MYPAFNEAHATHPEKGPEGAERYWESIDPQIAQIVRIMDEAETWNLENERLFRQALDQLIERLNQSPQLASYSLTHPRNVVEILAWMRTSSAMMLLHYSSDDRREVIDLFIRACQSLLEETDNDTMYHAASVAIGRFMAFERLALLRRLFSGDRAQAIERAVHTATQMQRTDNHDTDNGDGQ